MNPTLISLPASQALMMIYVSPAQVFEQLKSSRNWGWLALLMMFGIYMLSHIVFFGGIDPEWVVNKQLAAAGELSETEREELARVFRNFAEYSGISGGVISMVMTVLASLMLASFYMLVANSGNQKIEFNDWFVLALWTQLPVVCKYLGFLALFFITPSSELQLNMLDYSSFNQLFFSFDSEASLYQWAEYLDVFYLWQIGLAAIGIHVWCEFSYAKSLLIAALPYLLVFGTWLLLI